MRRRALDRGVSFSVIPPRRRDTGVPSSGRGLSQDGDVAGRERGCEAARRVAALERGRLPAVEHVAGARAFDEARGPGRPAPGSRGSPRGCRRRRGDRPPPAPHARYGRAGRSLRRSARRRRPAEAAPAARRPRRRGRTRPPPQRRPSAAEVRAPGDRRAQGQCDARQDRSHGRPSALANAQSRATVQAAPSSASGCSDEATRISHRLPAKPMAISASTVLQRPLRRRRWGSWTDWC